MPFRPKEPIYVNLNKWFPEDTLKELQREILDEITLVFDEAINNLNSKKEIAWWNYSINKNGTIDAQLNIVSPSSESDLRYKLTEMENAVRAIPNTWVSSGIFFQPRPDLVNDDNYKKIGGLNIITSYYQPAKKYHYNILPIRHAGLKLISENWDITNIFYRVHWNAMLERPDLGGEKAGQLLEE